MHTLTVTLVYVLMLMTPVVAALAGRLEPKDEMEVEMLEKQAF